jgi:hypothetical protein
MSNAKVTKDMSDNIKAAAILASFHLNKQDRILEAHATEKQKIVFRGSNLIPLRIGDNWFFTDTDVDIDADADLDSGALEAGKDYCVYACDNSGALVFKTSLATTFPAGFSAADSRKIGGFHTLCADVGIISGHALSGYVNRDILPASIWDLKHRARCGNNAGLVYDVKSGVWVDIYLASGTGTSTVSAHGGTISDTLNWMDFVDAGGAVGKRLLTDREFQLAAAGSNEETSIAGSADPVTTGGHSDTAGRRMISNIGCEDCCGVMLQWLQDQAYYHYGTTAAWGNLPGGKGSIYTLFTVDPGAPEMDNSDAGGDIKLLAGGYWVYAAYSGSRSRAAINYRWYANSYCGGRFASEPL